MNEFFQDGPVLKNQFEDDQVLKNYIEEKLPSSIKKEVTADLKRFGERVTKDVLEMAKSAESNSPKLVQFDPWGKRIDTVVVDRGWTDLHKVSAEEQIVKLGYERKYGSHSRIVQFAKLYLFHPSSAFYSCPLAMTDGAAKLIELYGDQELKSTYNHLTSDVAAEFWTSGQWMTERTGGSDVSNTETIARKIDGEWRLFGTKWFTSAITSEMSMALARIEDEQGNTVKGSRGLSLFYIEIKKRDGTLNNIEVLRLKDKLGTKALPTAELRLQGSKAKLVGNVGEGVKQIASMFNVTRLYNSVTSIAAFRRILCLASDYSTRRKAFEKIIDQHPLTARLLDSARSDFYGAFHFTFLVAEIFGNEEVFDESNIFKTSKEDLNKILRVLTPVLKLYTAKRTVQWTSELLEVFGGAGYIEDTGIPLLYRDNQVFAIWEGTTNVLSLDLLRALKKDQSWPMLMNFLKTELDKSTRAEKNKVQESLKKLNLWVLELYKAGDVALETEARELAFKLADLTGCVAWLRDMEGRTGSVSSQETKALSQFIEKHLAF
ncbi:acyl-CoA dehydrogenase [Bacteriovorax stolpii]|uniref:Acyl-CoA dehydrogenase n=1 Tax=Bacteriovorax stolpii TaxID=960 RepID=A0A2K9NTU8_BACTC|nr:acyl-CoA dehydrogenase family protein [Bacteriovorax stolpii]AUN98922.1 acyl-CoA dehydrogenase [Bacteriovorax stolpii]QDK41082.1 acyl-CoA dehydrogenase [Bacteriovorax stolpii]TDP55552.1 putative acyl-CoA dehydrogenase [Bacteriovorax stolpii]